MIGIFDSGVGGMTVARAVEQVLPSHSIVYFGDVARTPYGSKSQQTICRYACQDTEFLLDKGAKLIVVACNSAASMAGPLLKQRYDVPIIEVITPAVQLAVEQSSQGRIGVIGTRATINSGIYEQSLAELLPGCEVLSRACPLLVPLVEEGWLNKRESKMIVRRYLQPLKSRGVDTLVLGCTHSPLLRPLIENRIGKKVKVIDSSLAVAQAVKNFLADNQQLAASLSTNGQHHYYVSDRTEVALATAQRIFCRPVDLKQVSLS